MEARMIDINSGSSNPVAARLSNFTLRTFDFDGIKCLSIEGVLQSFKFDDGVALQRQICVMPPKKAKQMGSEFPGWKIDQKLYWNNQEFDRHGPDYQVLLTRLYNEAYQQDPKFKDDLLALGVEEFCHSIGKSDPNDTVLTEQEFIFQINRLRKWVYLNFVLHAQL
jgi:hypothetical protein